MVYLTIMTRIWDFSQIAAVTPTSTNKWVCTAVHPYILFLYTRVVYGTWYCTSTHDIKTLLCTHVQIHR